MFDRPPRYSVQSAKGPYVGYGVWDALGTTWLTEVDLPAADVLRIAGDLFQAVLPRELRVPEVIRVVVPARLTRVDGGSIGLLGAWVRAPGGWLAYVLPDGAMQAKWFAAQRLLPADHGEEISTG